METRRFDLKKFLMNNVLYVIMLVIIAAIADVAVAQVEQRIVAVVSLRVG